MHFASNLMYVLDINQDSRLENYRVLFSYPVEGTWLKEVISDLKMRLRSSVRIKKSRGGPLAEERKKNSCVILI